MSRREDPADMSWTRSNQSEFTSEFLCLDGTRKRAEHVWNLDRQCDLTKNGKITVKPPCQGPASPARARRGGARGGRTGHRTGTGRRGGITVIGRRGGLSG